MRHRTVAIDSYWLNALGFVADELPGLRSTVEHSDALVTVAGWPGAVTTDDDPALGVRDFTISGTMRATTAAALRANYRTLQYKASGGNRVITVQDDTSRRITARLRSIDFDYLGRGLDTPIARVVLQWRALTPFWEDTSDTTVNLTTSNADCALGTVAVWPVVTISGAATTPTLSYKNSAGTTLYSLTLTSISGGHSVTIDMATRTITHSVSGVSAALRTAGRFFPLDPYDGDYAASAWPKLVLSAGTGTAVYKKGYHG